MHLVMYAKAFAGQTNYQQGMRQQQVPESWSVWDSNTSQSTMGQLNLASTC